MKFLSIEIKNFRAIEEAAVKLSDRGLVAIRGENLDDSSTTSNGAGKSSLGEAIAWVCYGTTVNGGGGDEVVRRHSKGGCVVSVDIQDNGHNYRVSRYRKHGTYKNQLRLEKLLDDGSIVDLTQGTNALTQIRVEEILGCSFEVFTASIYAAQDAMPDLPGMTDKNLKVLIEEASGSNLLEAAYEEARAEYKKIINTLDDTRNNLERLESNLSHREDMASSLAASIIEWKNKREKDLAQYNENLEEVRDSIKNAVTFVSGYDPVEKYDERIAELTKKLLVNDDVYAILRVKESQSRDLDAKFATAESYKTVFTSELIQTQNKLKEIRNSIGMPCPHCNRPITEDEIEGVEKAYLEKIARLESTIEEQNTRKDELFESMQKLIDERDALQNSLVNVSDIIDQRRDLENEKDQINIHIGLIDSLRLKEKSIISAINHLKDMECPMEKPFDKNVAEMDILIEKMDEAKIDIENLEASANIAENVMKVFSPAGVRAFILDDVTPFLNDRTARYLSVLTDGAISAEWSTLTKNAKGELKENFSISVTNKHGADSFKGISGGEKRRVRIACALALQDLIARRASKPIELFFGDEIDDALDDAGLERLTQVLQDKAKERGSVFVISHNPSVKDWIDQTITVTKRKGGSTIKEEMA